MIFADAMTLTAEPAVEQAVRTHLRELADVLSKVIIQGQRPGDLRSDVDPDAAAWLVRSFLAAHKFRSTVMPDREQLEDQLGALTLHALVEPDSSNQQ